MHRMMHPSMPIRGSVRRGGLGPGSRSWRTAGGDYLCVDLDPAKARNQGQIITYYHDEMFRSLVTPGLDDMLEDLAAQLASGRCRIEDGMIEQD
jgi:hypothetical protein